MWNIEWQSGVYPDWTIPRFSIIEAGTGNPTLAVNKNMSFLGCGQKHTPPYLTLWRFLFFSDTPDTPIRLCVWLTMSRHVSPHKHFLASNTVWNICIKTRHFLVKNRSADLLRLILRPRRLRRKAKRRPEMVDVPAAFVEPTVSVQADMCSKIA